MKRENRPGVRFTSYKMDRVPPPGKDKNHGPSLDIGPKGVGKKVGMVHDQH